MAQAIHHNSAVEDEPKDPFAKIRDFARYQDGWDSYHSKAISEKVRERAVVALATWLKAVEENPSEIIHYFISPADDGNIVFEFFIEKKDGNLSLDVYEDRFEWFCARFNRNDEGETQSADDPKLLAAFAALKV